MKLLKRFDGLKFFLEAGRASYFYINYNVIKQYSEPHKLWPLTSVGTIANSKNHLTKYYGAVRDTKMFDVYLDRFIKNPSHLKMLEEYLTKIRKNTIKKLKINLKKLNNRELAGLISYYNSQFRAILRAAATLRWVDRAIVPRLRKLFETKENTDEAIRLAAVSRRLSFSLSEELAILKLAAKLLKMGIAPEKAEKDIEKIRNKFCWSVLGYYNELPKTKGQYVLVLKERIANNPNKLLYENRKRVNDEINKRKEISKVLDKEGKLLIKIASESSYLKDYFKSSINEMEYHAERLFEEIAKRTGKTVDFLKDFAPDEIQTLLLDGKVDERTIQERIKHHVIVTIGTDFYVLSGEDAHEFENKFLLIKETKESEFKGRAASPGHVEGNVKVILSGKDFHKLKEGDILVVTNTSPDFVPIMKRAAAIVAEEGGITAHVSVVSRELGVPCIVGIPHITNLLKDGDLVEVDANKGIVRKIR